MPTYICAVRVFLIYDAELDIYVYARKNGIFVLDLVFLIALIVTIFLETVMRISTILIAAFTAAFCVAGIAGAQDQQFLDNMQKFLASEKGQDSLIDALQNSAARRQQQQMQKTMDEQMKHPVAVDYGNSPSTGPANAKVTIAEFSDFECPFCKRGHVTMKQLLQAYPKDVRVVFKNRPLPMHKNARSASKAAMAANKQGKFWEMADALFENQSKLGQDFYMSQAKALGLNVDKFKADMEAPETEAAIKADEAQADKLEVNGTPGFFVNGVSLQGAQPVEQFKAVIDKLMADKGAPAAAPAQKK